MFNTNAQCYQNISQVLMTSAFILWPTCTRGFGIREKIRCRLRFFGVFLCGFAVFGPPLRLPPKYTRQKVNMGTKTKRRLLESSYESSATLCPRTFDRTYRGS